MNKLVWIITSLSIVITSLITYQVTVLVKDSDYVKKEELKTYVDQYIAQSPDIIFSTFVKGAKLQEQALVEKKRQALLDSKDELENDPSSPYVGNEKGDVKIVMFSDYRCGYCKKTAPILEQLLKNDAGLKVIVKELPVLGPASVISANAALAVFKLDKSKFAAFNKRLYKKPLGSEADLLAMAKAAGIDGKALLIEMAKPEYQKIIQKNNTLGSSLGVDGTPAFVIDGVLYPGALPEEQLLALIKNVREKNKTKL